MMQHASTLRVRAIQGQVEPRPVAPRDFARELLARRPNVSGRKQFMLGVVGVPGSGKSTFAGQVEKHLPNSVSVPMDGFHYSRATLDQMEDPAEAHKRRGAPFTFDAPAFVDTLRRIRATGSAEFPTFDHAEGDPKWGDGSVSADKHRFIIVEGLYLLLQQQPWDEIRDILDETIFLHVPLQAVAMERVYRRQVENGATPETALRRIHTNDFPNGQLVEASAERADRVIAAMLDTPTLPVTPPEQAVYMPPLIPMGFPGLTPQLAM